MWMFFIYAQIRSYRDTSTLDWVLGQECTLCLSQCNSSGMKCENTLSMLMKQFLVNKSGDKYSRLLSRGDDLQVVWVIFWGFSLRRWVPQICSDRWDWCKACALICRTYGSSNMTTYSRRPYAPNTKPECSKALRDSHSEITLSSASLQLQLQAPLYFPANTTNPECSVL